MKDMNVNFVDLVANMAMEMNKNEKIKTHIDTLRADNCTAEELELFEFESLIKDVSRACANILLFGYDYKKFLYVAKGFLDEAYEDVQNSIWKGAN